MIAATAHTASTGTEWLSGLLGYWWLALLFGGAALEWLGETFDVGLTALYRRAELRHRRQMDLKRVELEILQARSWAASASPPPSKPGPCVHRNVVQVRDHSDELVGWLCRGCDTQLPADWAVRQEDL